MIDTAWSVNLKEVVMPVGYSPRLWVPASTTPLIGYAVKKMI